jgi:hypothetical protein
MSLGFFHSVHGMPRTSNTPDYALITYWKSKSAPPIFPYLPKTEALKESRRLRTNHMAKNAQNLRASTAIANKTYHCDICSQTFSRKTHFEAHQKKQSHLKKAAVFQIQISTGARKHIRQ